MKNHFSYSEEYIVTAIRHHCFMFSMFFFHNFQRSNIDKGIEVFKLCSERLKEEFEFIEVYLSVIKMYIEKITFKEVEDFVSIVY